MKFHQMLYFYHTAKLQHVGQAARSLAVSPSAISHSIAALEDELGRQLFYKRGKRIVLSEHGKKLMDRVCCLLADVDRIRDELQDESAELQGHFRLAGSHYMCTEVLAPSLFELQDSHPKLTAEIVTLRSAQVLSGVASGEYDFGLCFSPQYQPEVSMKKIYDGRLVVAVSKKHPLRKARAETLSPALSDLPAVVPKSYRGIENCQMHPVLETWGIRVKTALLYDNYEVAIAKIKHSSAWGFLPEWVANHSGLAVLPLVSSAAAYYVAGIWPSQRHLDRSLQALLDKTEENLSKITSGLV